MQILIKAFIKYLPVITVVFVLVFVQLLFIGTNIIGIILYGRLFVYRDTYKILSAAAITSLIYDSVKMLPLGSWTFSFCVIAVLALIIVNVLKLHTISVLESWPSVVLLFVLTVSAATIQSYVLLRISGQNAFDFNSLYSIVTLSIIFIIFQKITHKKERRLLLD